MAESSSPAMPDAWMKWRFNDPMASAGELGSSSFVRYEFARSAAPVICELRLPGQRFHEFRAASPVSLRTVLFVTDDDSTMVCVVGGHEQPNDVAKALGYALEHVGDRDLIMALPDRTQWSTLARLPWIDHHIRVLVHDDDVLVDEVGVPLRSVVLDRVRDSGGFVPYVLSAKHLGWVDELVAWADGHPQLLRSDRSSYVGWQVQGRLVLKIARASGDRLRVSCGVRPGSSSPKASGFEVVIDGPLLDPEPFRAAMRAAIANRLQGVDGGNLEHRLQARLLSMEPADRMGLVTLVPEYPALRPGPAGNASGYLDFLGVDGSGRLHVVETKVGASESTVVLQALDYWVWAEANRAPLAVQLGADPSLQTAVSIVVTPGDDGALLLRHNRFVIDRLARSVRLELWSAFVDLSGNVRLREVPVWSERANSRWPDRMRLRVRSAVALDAVPRTPDENGMVAVGPLAGLPHAALAAARTLDAAGGLHSHVGTAHSSQRFALELFAPLGYEGARRLLTRQFGPMASAAEPEFEWTDPTDRLAESTAKRPHRTQVDVLLRGVTVAGERVGLLVEVKLTESDFGGCSHAEVAPPERRGACDSEGPFGGDSSANCWQLRNRELGSRRRYDEVLTFSRSVEGAGVGCWFHRRNQPMRLAALAAALVEGGEFDRCVTVLTAPQGHASIRRRWAETIDMIEGEQMGWLDPEVVLTSLEPDLRARLIDRYGLGAPDATLNDPVPLEVRAWELVGELLSRHPDRFLLIKTHPAGGMYECLALYRTPPDSPYGDDYFDINLVGSLHYWPPGAGLVSMRDVWHRLAEGRYDDVVAWCEQQAGLEPVPEERRRFGFRVMGEIARRHHQSGKWFNGYFDHPMSAEVNETAFAAMPFLRPERDEHWVPFDQPAYRYWFHGTHDGGLVAIDVPNSTAWTLDGRRYSLITDADAFRAAVL